MLVEALLLHPLAGRGAGAIVLEVVGGLLRQQKSGAKTRVVYRVYRVENYVETCNIELYNFLLTEAWWLRCVAVATPGRRLARERGTCDSYSPYPTLQQIDTSVQSHTPTLSVSGLGCYAASVTVSLCSDYCINK